VLCVHICKKNMQISAGVARIRIKVKVTLFP
jgi:hypothetical protein